MSLEAAQVKEEPECAVSEPVCIKFEPEWVKTESEYVAPELCLKEEAVCVEVEPVCVEVEPVSANEEPICVIQDVVHVELEPVDVKDEQIGVQQPACVAVEPSWGDSDSAAPEPEPEVKYEITLDPCQPPPETENVKRSMLVRECSVRLERCVLPNATATANQPAAVSRHTRKPYFLSISDEHEREIAMKQLSGLLIRPINLCNKKSYWCKICKISFKYLPLLTSHKKVHVKKKRGSKKYKLSRSNPPLSSFSVSSQPPSTGAQDTRREPITPTAVEQKINTYACEICKVVFADLDSLKVHIISHAKVNVRCNVCEICYAEFPTNFALNKHKRFHDESSRPFLCSICKKRFTRAADLSKHISHAHRAKDKSLCKGCEKNKALKQLGNLLKSELETNENTDFCEICNNVLDYPNSLTV